MLFFGQTISQVGVCSIVNFTSNLALDYVFHPFLPDTKRGYSKTQLTQLMLLNQGTNSLLLVFV